MKTTSIWHNLPLISNVLSTGPFLQTAQPTTFYSEANLAMGQTTLPTAALYSPASATVGDIIGKHIGAPLYDNISAAVRKIRQRFSPAPNTLGASAQQFVGPTTKIGGMSFATKSVTTAMAVAAMGSVGCSAALNLSDPLTKAILSAVAVNFAGGLTLFLYGMNLIDDGLKTAGGTKIKEIIGKLTGNRFSALGVGAGVTAVIQSSSITTVMTLSLVDAGLMSLTAALGVVAGANIGTTMTAWLFATNIAKAGPLMMAGAQITKGLAKSELVKNISTGVFGLGMVFFGLTTMSAGFKDPAIEQALIDLFGRMNSTSFWDVGACIGLSALITAGIQSSSAMMGVTIFLAHKGILPYETAVPLVLGSNVGTTITAWLATLRSGTTTEAKRVAIAHSLFNILGVLAIWPWSSTFAGMSKNAAETIGLHNPGLQLALAHTLFNVMASAGFLATINPFERLVTRLAPHKVVEEAGYGQRRLKAATRLAPPFALGVSQELIVQEMNPRVEAMLDDLLASMTGKKTTADVRPTIFTGEDDLDRFQEVLFRHFNRVERTHLNRKTSATLDAQRRITSNLESIGDNLKKLLLIRLRDLPADLSDEARDYLRHIHQEVLDHFILVSQAVANNNPNIWAEAEGENDKLKGLIAKQQEYPAHGSTKAQIFYTDALGLYRELLGNIKNIAEALAGRK